jgi:hypothetical protein
VFACPWQEKFSLVAAVSFTAFRAFTDPVAIFFIGSGGWWIICIVGNA